jgi:hypothetical protein
MKTFKSFISTLREAVDADAKVQPVQIKDKPIVKIPKKKEEKIQEPENKPEKKEPIKNSDDWTKSGDSWLIHFELGGQHYTVIFTPNDETEEHWTFNYSKKGQKDSSDIKKFGSPAEWTELWGRLNAIIKDFLQLVAPKTVKFVGMSDSKRREYYRELFKVIVKHYWNYFKKQGYHSTFDYRDISRAPSFVIKKGSHKEPEKKNEN